MREQGLALRLWLVLVATLVHRRLCFNSFCESSCIFLFVTEKIIVQCNCDFENFALVVTLPPVHDTLLVLLQTRLLPLLLPQ